MSSPEINVSIAQAKPDEIEPKPNLTLLGKEFTVNKFRKDFNAAQLSITSAIDLNDPRRAIGIVADIVFDCIESTRNYFGAQYAATTSVEREQAIEKIYIALADSVTNYITRYNLDLIRKYPGRADNPYLSRERLDAEIKTRINERKQEQRYKIRPVELVTMQRKYTGTSRGFEAGRNSIIAAVKDLQDGVNKDQTIKDELRAATVSALQEADIPGRLISLEEQIYDAYAHAKDLSTDEVELKILQAKLANLYSQICTFSARYNITSAIENSTAYSPDAAIQTWSNFNSKIQGIVCGIENRKSPDGTEFRKLIEILKATYRGEDTARADEIVAILQKEKFIDAYEALKKYQAQLYVSLWGKPDFEEFVYRREVPIVRNPDRSISILGQPAEQFLSDSSRMPSNDILVFVTRNRRNNDRGIQNTKKKMRSVGRIIDMYYSKDMRDKLDPKQLEYVRATPDDFKKMLLALYRIDVFIGTLRDASNSYLFGRIYSEYKERVKERKKKELSRRASILGSDAALMRL